MSGLFDDQATKPGWTVPLGWTADNEGRCRSCGAEVLWCITPAGKRAPVNRDGTSHFADCPQARDWRRRASGPIEVGPGLRVRYTEVVECDHYLVETEDRRFLRQRVAELAPVPAPTDRRPAQSPDDLEARRHAAWRARP